MKCKHCGQDNEQGIKKCVKCGKDQRNFFIKHKFTVGIIILLLIICITGCDGFKKGFSDGMKNTQTETTK